MNGHANGDDVAARNGSALVVVRIEDAVDPALTGRAGGVYESPPQPRERAMTLVRLLLGSVAEPPSGGERWVAPIGRPARRRDQRGAGEVNTRVHASTYSSRSCRVEIVVPVPAGLLMTTE